MVEMAEMAEMGVAGCLVVRSSSAVALLATEALRMATASDSRKGVGANTFLVS